MRELSCFSLGKKSPRLRAGLMALYKCLKGGGSQSRGNGLRLLHGRFRLDIRKNFFMESAVKHWSRLSREVIESPSLEILERHVDVALKDMVVMDLAVLSCT